MKAAQGMRVLEPSYGGGGCGKGGGHWVRAARSSPQRAYVCCYLGPGTHLAYNFAGSSGFENLAEGVWPQGGGCAPDLGLARGLGDAGAQFALGTHPGQ